MGYRGTIRCSDYGLLWGNIIDGDITCDKTTTSTWRDLKYRRCHLLWQGHPQAGHWWFKVSKSIITWT